MNKIYKLSELLDSVVDNRGKTPQTIDNGIPLIEINSIADSSNKTPNYKLIKKYIDENVYSSFRSGNPQKDDILIGTVGSIGTIAMMDDTRASIAQNLIALRCKHDIEPNWLYYMLKYKMDEILSLNIGGVQPSIKVPHLMSMELSVPEKDEQVRISKIISSFDDKLISISKQNEIILDLIMNIYLKKFNDDYTYIENKRSDEIADITIGGTPSRSNSLFFTKNPEEKDIIKWVSISDLGKCDSFINNTSEYLTSLANEKCKIKIVPADTLLLSFKLTVGRIAITSCQMATNEAIAHYNLYDKDLLFYLFCYLKNYNYDDLGSTSSIAKAVNSKIIKGLTIKLPNKEDLNQFNRIVEPLFHKLKNNVIQSEELNNIKNDALLKVMKED